MSNLANDDDANQGYAPGNARRRSRLNISSPRRRVTFAVALLVIVAGAILGARWIIYSRTHASTDDAYVEADIFPVSPRIAGHVLMVLIEQNQPVRRGQLLVEIDPQDYRIAVQEAQAALTQAASAAGAAAGNVNLTEETGAAGISQARAQVVGAEAGVRTSEQQGESASAQVQSAQADEAAAAAAIDGARHDVSVAEAALVSARAQADEARKNAARADQLLASGAVAAQQRDAALATSISMQANVEAAAAKVQAARAGLRQAEQHHRQAVVAVAQARQRAAAAHSQVAQARAAVKQAQAALQSAQTTPVQAGVRKSEARGAAGRVAEVRARLSQARLNLSYTRIVAPVDGVVAKKNVEPGQFVQPGQSLVAVLAAGSEHITANFKETQMARIRVGQRVTFTVDPYPGVPFHGRVQSISPGTGAVFSLLPPENASGNFTKVVQRIPVRISINRHHSQAPILRAGMSAVVTVKTK